MENISIKLETAIARQIEKDIKEFHYSTKTEFIRDSIRDKLKANALERERKKAMEKLLAMRGILKGKEKSKSFDEWHNWRSNEGSKLLMQELSKKYGWKD